MTVYLDAIEKDLSLVVAPEFQHHVVLVGVAADIRDSIGYSRSVNSPDHFPEINCVILLLEGTPGSLLSGDCDWLGGVRAECCFVGNLFLIDGEGGIGGLNRDRTKEQPFFNQPGILL